MNDGLTKQLTIYSDYVCPWCYVGQAAVEKLKAEHNLQVSWKPFFLRPDTPPEGMELPDNLRARASMAMARLQQMARANGMEMVSPGRIPNTRLAHEATEYAREHGKDQEFHRIVFHKYYGEGQDIGSWDVLRAAAEKAGLNADDLVHQVTAGRYAAAVARQIQEAHKLGISSVPTYILNNHYTIVGAQPYEVFEKALQQLTAEADSKVNRRSK